MPNSPESNFNPASESEETVSQTRVNPETRRPVQEDETAVSYLGVRLEKAKTTSEFTPKREQYQDYISDRFALELQQKIAVSWLEGDPILVEAGTSVGKTTTARKMCSELGWEVHYANLNGATDVEDLMGRYIPNPHRTKPDDPEYVFADGRVTAGLRQEEGKTKVVVLDEINAAAPNILIRLHEVLDAIERNGEVVLSEDASESVEVSKQKTKIVAFMNPPGKGYFGREPLDPAQLRRWVYQKEVTDLPPDTFNYSTEALFGLVQTTEEVSEKSFLVSRENKLSPEALAEIPGMQEVLQKYQEFHRAAKEMVKERKVGADQPQPFTFDDRMEPRRVRDFVLRFYSGDINDTVQTALRYYYLNKLESPTERQKLEELIRHVGYVPTAETRRRTLDEQASRPESTTKTRTEKELADLLTRPEVPDSVKEALRSSETVLSPDILEAKTIMGADFVGPEEAKNAFGIEGSVEAPAIPFSKEELERAKELGQMLVLRLPMTMAEINEKLSGKVKDGKKLLYAFDEKTGKLKDDCWYKDEKFLREEKMEVKWALVSKDVVPETTSKNYLDQTDRVVDYLQNQVFKDRPLPEAYRTAIDEFQKARGGIAETLSSDWRKAAEMLEGLQITELTRQTPAEALYDLAAYFQTTGERLLPNVYTWTKRRRSGGRLVRCRRLRV